MSVHAEAGSKSEASADGDEPGTMTRMLSEPGSIERWFFDPRPVHALVAGRIVFGVVLLLCYLVRLPDMFALYGANGIAGPHFIQELVPSQTIFQALYVAAGLDLPALGPVGLSLVYAALLISAVSFALGYRTRTSGVILWLLHLFFFKLRLPLAYWGWPALLQGFLLYVILSRAGHFASVDAWLERRRTGAAPVPISEWQAPAWPLRLLQVHLCAMYMTVGWSRIDASGWLQGHTVFTALTMSLHSKLVIDWAPFKPLLSLATWGVFALEPLAPFLLWVPRVGPWVVYLLLAMHGGLELMTNVGWWGFTVIPGLLAFLPQSQLEMLFRKLRLAD